MTRHAQRRAPGGKSRGQAEKKARQHEIWQEDEDFPVLDDDLLLQAAAELHVLKLLRQGAAPGVREGELLLHPQGGAVVGEEVEIEADLTRLVPDGCEGGDDIVVGVVLHQLLDLLPALQDGLIQQSHFSGELDVFPRGDLPYVPAVIAPDVKLGQLAVVLVAPEDDPLPVRNDDPGLQAVQYVQQLFDPDRRFIRHSPLSSLPSGGSPRPPPCHAPLIPPNVGYYLLIYHISPHF